jgi:putative transposase
MVISGLPHHVTQGGNRREAIFFENGDHEIYRDTLAEQLPKSNVEVWAYCLMPNHLHLILNPQQSDLMGRALGEAHRRDTNFINERGRWTGHLFQSRFASVAMDESHLRAAVSYVSLNPVRARLVSRAEEWAWPSVRAHIAGEDDGLVSVRPVLGRWPNFRDLLLQDYDEAFTSLRKAEGIGRPLGTADFVIELERRLGRPIARRTPGRKATAIPQGEQLKLLR